MSNSEQFDADYFLRGKETGKSLYENYHWLPDLTIPMVKSIIRHIGMFKSDTILDFGCARGYVVKAFRQLDYTAHGIDISEWAIKNCDKDVKDYVYCCNGDKENHLITKYDWIISKDVLEHIPKVSYVIDTLLKHANKGVFAVVPLSRFDNSRYVIEEYEKDITHVQRHTLLAWMEMFIRPGWKVECSYKVNGIKNNYYKTGWEMGNGFITARRIEGGK